MRWREVKEFRDGNAPPDESLRNFLADLQTRFLIAEFIRRVHHLRPPKFKSLRKAFKAF